MPLHYTSTADYAGWPRRLLLMTAAVNVIAVAAGLVELSLLAPSDSLGDLGDDEIDGIVLSRGLIDLLQAALFVATAVFFIRWFRAAYGCLPAFGVPRLRYGTRWAIGAWFVPLVNYVVPKQLADDIWRGSDPARAGARDQDWTRRPVPAVVHWWWVAFVVSDLLGIGARYHLAFDEGKAQDTLVAANGLFLGADITAIVAALLAIVVIRRITERQEEAAAAAQTAH